MAHCRQIRREYDHYRQSTLPARCLEWHRHCKFNANSVDRYELHNAKQMVFSNAFEQAEYSISTSFCTEFTNIGYALTISCYPLPQDLLSIAVCARWVTTDHGDFEKSVPLDFCQQSEGGLSARNIFSRILLTCI